MNKKTVTADQPKFWLFLLRWFQIISFYESVKHKKAGLGDRPAWLTKFPKYFSLRYYTGGDDGKRVMREHQPGKTCRACDCYESWSSIVPACRLQL